MSLLLVSGKIYLCENCEKTTKVEYSGGAQYTQIGDELVSYQLQLSEQLGQPNENPEKQGFYLYDICLCEKCFTSFIQPKLTEQELLAIKIFELYQALMDERDRIIDKFDVNSNGPMEEIFSELSTEDFCEIGFNPNDIDPNLLTKTKKRKVGKFLHNNREGVEAWIFDKLMSNSKYETVIEDHNLKCKRKFEYYEIDKFKNSIVTTYHKKNISMPENLNPYIICEFSVREPFDKTEKNYVYYQYEVDLYELFNETPILKDELKDCVGRGLNKLFSDRVMTMLNESCREGW